MRELYLQSLLTDLQSEKAGESIAVTRLPCRLGRHSECDCRFDDPLISRHHCELFLVGDDVWVRDLRSRNGTWVNGKRLCYPHKLEDQDRLDVGQKSFRVHLVQPTSNGESEPLPQPQPAFAERQQVLIVEDDATTAAGLAYILGKWGHEVEVARDGREALALAQAHQPDTVLLELHLPGMNGYE